MSYLAIFDREDLMQAINRECLSEPGNSALIIGAHKVGKTHLLNHINSKSAIGQESLFCKVDLDMLHFFAGGPALSDDVFLRFFLITILQQINDWIEKQSEEKESWQSSLSQVEEELATHADVNDLVTQMSYQDKGVTIKALKERLRELGKLINVAGKIQTLIDQETPLKSSNLIYILNDLHSARKRIVLIIDEFNLMIKEQGFNDNLFRFLRGANNEGKIIVLASSTVHPMDASLHPYIDKSERRTLFNHFKIQSLNPFTKKEAGDFLDWLPNAALPLDAEESAYLQKLGGGSPFFLKAARDRYLQYNRPRETDARREFEQQGLFPDLIGPFSQIWERCSDEERSILLRIAAGETQDASSCLHLEKEGYLIGGQSNLEIFSPLFADFIKQVKSFPPESSVYTPAQPPPEESFNIKEKPRTPLKVSVEIPCAALPTALYIANFKYADLVTFKIFNHTKMTWRIRLYCEILDYSQKTERFISVPPGLHTETLPVTFHVQKISNLKDTVPTQIDCQADLILGSEREALFSETIRVILLPVDNFIFTRFDPAKKCWIDFTWLITAWVSRRGKLLRKIIDCARKIQPQVGRPIPKGEAGRTLLEAQVEAIYRALKEHGLEYHNQVLVFHQEDNDYVQRVQFPDETLRGRAANCLDTSVLFASLLSMCDLDPAILLMRGHALVGWKALKNTNAEWRFMETTAISTMTFQEACQIGQKKYKEVQHLCGSARTGSFTFNPQEFAVLLDVHEIWRKQRILPLLIE